MMAQVTVCISLQWTMRARLLFVAYAVAVAIGIDIDSDKAARAIANHMRIAVA
jgi:hypothetical protein